MVHPRPVAGQGRRHRPRRGHRNHPQLGPLARRLARPLRARGGGPCARGDRGAHRGREDADAGVRVPGQSGGTAHRRRRVAECRCLRPAGGCGRAETGCRPGSAVPAPDVATAAPGAGRRGARRCRRAGAGRPRGRADPARRIRAAWRCGCRGGSGRSAGCGRSGLRAGGFPGAGHDGVRCGRGAGCSAWWNRRGDVRTDGAAVCRKPVHERRLRSLRRPWRVGRPTWHGRSRRRPGLRSTRCGRRRRDGRPASVVRERHALPATAVRQPFRPHGGGRRERRGPGLLGARRALHV